MEAQQINVRRFFSLVDHQFIIPVYQRNYDWTHKQCAQLFDDIMEVGANPQLKAHFIGSVVYIHDDVYSVASMTELVIIDGQQRLTTITLIYLALYHLALDLKDNALANRIKETYLINTHESGNEKLKLRPTENNDKALKFLLRYDKKEEYLEYSNLVLNFNYFKSKITKDNYDIVMQGLSKIMFVYIALDRVNDNPQRIFESLNSTGLDLSASDLIRNYILMQLNPEEQKKIYTNYWEIIENLAKDEENNKSKVTDFIKNYLTTKSDSKTIPKIEKIYSEFKKTNPHTNVVDLEERLKKMKISVQYYNKLINPNKENDKKIRIQLQYVKKLEIDVLYPFLMKVYEDYGEGVIDKSIFIEVLHLVQSFVWRRFIVDLPSNALSNIFAALHDKIDKNNYLVSLQKALLRHTGKYRFPKDIEVKKVLKEKDVYNIKPKNRLYLLDKLENHENNEPVDMDSGNITIEHIFPQNPEAKWKTTLDDNDYYKLKETYLNTIANLTLSGSNTPLGNKIFEYKRDLENGGFKESRLMLNKYLAKLDKWDLEELNKRFEVLYNRFLEIWTFPNIKIVEDDDSSEVQNIFDAEDPTSKRIEFAIVFGEKFFVPQQHAARFYQEVIKRLFELNPTVFFETDLKTRLGLTEKGQEGKLRQATSITTNDDYFVDTHSSSAEKFERLKYVLTKLGYEDEVFIKYADGNVNQLPLM